MKKFLALLLTVAMVFAMAACSAPAAEETKPAEEGTAAPAEETSEQPAASGSVYYLNFKPEADAAWQELAKKYTELTGVSRKGRYRRLRRLSDHSDLRDGQERGSHTVPVR